MFFTHRLLAVDEYDRNNRILNMAEVEDVTGMKYIEYVTKIKLFSLKTIQGICGLLAKIRKCSILMATISSTPQTV